MKGKKSKNLMTEMFTTKTNTIMQEIQERKRRIGILLSWILWQKFKNEFWHGFFLLLLLNFSTKHERKSLAPNFEYFDKSVLTKFFIVQNC